MSIVSKRYAQAYFELACEEDKLALCQKQIKTVLTVLEDNKDLGVLLNHYAIEKDDKKQLIGRLFDKDVDDLVIRFIDLLIDKNRISEIKDIFSDFNDLANDSFNVVEGKIYSTKLLSNDDLKLIEDELSKKYLKTVMLTNLIDDQLISGVKVVIKDEVIDGSLANRLNMLKTQLLRKAGK
ncbi:MAG: F0F1 ATP synthase subunit delta [Erysipelotrichaceae bacterium]